jgi:hypothetical protein
MPIGSTLVTTEGATGRPLTLDLADAATVRRYWDIIPASERNNVLAGIFEPYSIGPSIQKVGSDAFTLSESAIVQVVTDKVGSEAHAIAEALVLSGQYARVDALTLSEAAVKTSSGPELAFAPPTLTTPTTIANFSGSYLQLDNQVDYIINLPTSNKTNQCMIEGGRNIRIIKGKVTNSTWSGAAVFYFTDNGTNGAAQDRVIHVEGVDIDMSVGTERDAFGLQCPKAIVQIQNCKAMGVRGTGAGVHGDIIQHYSNVRGLKVDRFTGSSNYQGFFLSPQDGLYTTGIDLRRVNMTLNTSGTDPTSQLLFLVSATAEQTAGIALSDVYINNLRSSQTAQNACYPDASGPAGKTSSYSGGIVSWPTVSSITGVVNNGSPPGGDFAASDVGLSYVSPGYA